MLHMVIVRPFRLRDHSTELACDTSRIVGYVAHCKCGWRGKVRAGHSEARLEGREHARTTGGQLRVM